MPADKAKLRGSRAFLAPDDDAVILFQIGIPIPPGDITHEKNHPDNGTCVEHGGSARGMDED
jgi:hypothetical protein